MSTDSLLATEAECAPGRTAPRVSLQDLEANIAGIVFFTGGQAVYHIPHCTQQGLDSDKLVDVLDTLTICLLTTENGFTLVGKSAPASRANFDAELGAKLAYEDAVRQLWPLMGYELRQRLYNEENTDG